ncbi:MAG TPA: hypothetical protein DD444_08590 [Citreicella sp.]|nr:hypothetical protein [Citreicella sp.]HBT00788.1 hypothetical protein [Citreicella sp.]
MKGLFSQFTTLHNTVRGFPKGCAAPLRRGHGRDALFCGSSGAEPLAAPRAPLMIAVRTADDLPEIRSGQGVHDHDSQ